MGRRRAKKPKTVVDPDNQAKIEKLKKLICDFKVQAAEYESYLNTACVNRCTEIEKHYQDQLKMFPENFRNMNFVQVLELQEAEKVRETECPKDENAIRMQFERQKLTSERKRTQRKEKKRSISAPSSARYPLNCNLTRTTSELSVLTPVSKMRKPSTAVTPKFNPNFPVIMARKPKPGEIVMSLSGSPLRNVVDDLPTDKPYLSLGKGRVITFNDNAEPEVLNGLFKSIDEPLKSTILDVQKKLNEILKK